MKLSQALLTGVLLASPEAMAEDTPPTLGATPASASAPVSAPVSQQEDREPRQISQATLKKTSGVYVIMSETSPTKKGDNRLASNQFDITDSTGVCVMTNNVSYQALQIEPGPVYIDTDCKGGFIPFITKGTKTPIMLVLDEQWDLSVYPYQKEGANGLYTLRPHDADNVNRNLVFKKEDTPKVVVPTSAARRIGVYGRLALERAFEINGVRDPSAKFVPGVHTEARCLVSPNDVMCVGASLDADVVSRSLPEYHPELLRQDEDTVDGIRMRPAVTAGLTGNALDDRFHFNLDVLAGMIITAFTESPGAYRRHDNEAPLDLPRMWDIQAFVALRGDMNVELIDHLRCGFGLEGNFGSGSIDFPSQDIKGLLSGNMFFQCGLEILVPKKAPTTEKTK